MFFRSSCNLVVVVFLYIIELITSTNFSSEASWRVYNKAIDLKNQSSNIETENGLIRLETSLKRKFLKANNLISSDFIEINEVGSLLCQILTLSECLLKKYITDSFFEGRMLSKKLQKKSYSKVLQ